VELIHKILHALRRTDYDLVTIIPYEKKLNTMTPNLVLNKVTAHELRNDIKPRAPPSSPTHSALTSKQEKLLKKMAIKQTSSEEEESQCSSSDEDGVMPSKLFKEVKIMNKSLKKINLMGYMIFLKDGPHHQHMKVERRFKKKKEKKHKEEAFVALGEWTSGGEESSTSSSDESNKTFPTRFNMGVTSSSNICLMAKCMESDVSDDDSDSPSYEELLDLVHEHQRVIKKQFRKYDALNDLNATLTTNYDNLMCKF